MKYALPLVVAALAALAAAPAVAQENTVSGDALSAVGLGGMKVVGEESGMKVRGKFSASKATSLSFVQGVFFDPHTGSQMTFGSNGFGTNKTLTDKAGPDNAAVAAAASLTVSPYDVEFTTATEGVPAFYGTAKWTIIGFGVGASKSISLPTW